MSDAVLEVATSVMRSPWLYLLLFGIVYVDAFLPAIPSEATVITAGVFAVAGTPDLLLIVLVATAGATRRSRIMRRAWATTHPT